MTLYIVSEINGGLIQNTRLLYLFSVGDLKSPLSEKVYFETIHSYMVMLSLSSMKQ
ncbi:unnamed protein product [Paramecium primaurelia]|uniref:Uncharacterized protein n=1 Tax=Paramecium primaurelia TaxID=5886 RepID=A0A8S1JLL7_PARPR|nr:unnamed protein product [Paramecium primaurelia]